MTSENIRTHVAGSGASGDVEVTSTSEKMWYPFTPDVIEGVDAYEEWATVNMVGGHSYYTNAKWKMSKGSAMNARLQGCWYEGGNKSAHKDHRFSIFAGGTGSPISRDHPNGNSFSNFQDADVQFPGSFVVHCNGYINKAHTGSQWQMYSKMDESTQEGGLGFPYPVYGVTLDYTPCRHARTVDNDGDVWSHDTADYDYAFDCQINFFHAVYWKAGDLDYCSRKLLPNGDNWGDTRGGKDYSDIEGGKYCFRNTSDLSTGADCLMGSYAQERSFPKGGKSEPGTPFRMRLMLPPGEGPPKNSYFVGITMQMVYGEWARVSKNRQYMISNLGIIDKVAYDIYKDKPEYHGFNAKNLDNPHMVLPKLYDFKHVSYPHSPRFYGPMQSW